MIPEVVARLEALTGIRLEYRVAGMLMLGFSEADRQHLEEAFRWQEEAGLHPERVSGEQVRRMEPAVTGPVLGGLHWPQCAQLDPRRFAAAVEQAVRKEGAEVRLNTPVNRISLKGRRAVGVETPSGNFEADWIVHCAGPWSSADYGLPFSIPVVPARGQVLQFSTSAPLFRKIVKSSRAYLVQRTGDSLIAGTTLEYVGFDRRVTEDGCRAILGGVGEISSRAGSLPVLSSWAGLRPDTPDHLPILGPTPLENFWVATGHFRNGVLLAPLTGRLIADGIFGVRSSISLAPFGLSRFMVG